MKRFLTRSWLIRHALALVLIAAFVVLGLWQLGRASEGNAISWAYTFEWPLFALFVVGLWVREVRDELRASRGEIVTEPPLTSPYSAARRPVAVAETTGDDETDAYNRYLAWLSANPDRSPHEYPGEDTHG